MNHSAGTRFVLHFNPVQKSLESVNEVKIASETPALSIYASGKDVYIKNSDLNARIFIYNLLGRQVYNSVITSDGDNFNLFNSRNLFCEACK